jgi:dTDP-4-amino-4,6-dideoxygalactose transaminase
VIRFQRPSLPSAAAIEAYLAAAREERWFSNFGPCCLQLRERLRDMAGCDAVPVANATLGLAVAVTALRRRGPPGATEAAVPSFAFAASAQAAIWNGLEPVFVDVDPEHWHLAPEALERALDQRAGQIAVVIALSSFGTPPPPAVRRRWEEACRSAGVPLLVDSAAGFGGRAADGTLVGAQGDAEVVSFHAVKPLAIGEGGAVFARDPDLKAEILRLTQFGFDDQRQVVDRHGINAKLSEPSAAIALAALDDFERHLNARRAAATRILERLPSGYRLQQGHEHGTWQFVPVAAASREARDAVLEGAIRKVEMRRYYEPLHLMQGFADASRASSLHVTEDLGGRMLSMPMADDLSLGEIEAIVEAVSAGAPTSDTSRVGVYR